MARHDARIQSLNEELNTAQIERDAAIDDGDANRVHELDLEIERITEDLSRFEMLAEKAAI